MFLEFKKNRERYEVNVFESKHSRKSGQSEYRNILDKDSNKLGQILIDLYMYGFPIEKAIQIFNEKLRKKDWLGL